MTDAFASVAGQRITSLRLVAGNIGPWFADLEFESDPSISGQVTIVVGAAQFVGTVVAQQAGTFGLQRKCRVVGGAGGWSTMLGPKSYHNDAGVKAQLIATDAAREVGETLGSFQPAAERVGYDYVRRAALASSVLEFVIGDVAWWVGYDGVTNVGPRPATAVASSAYELIAFDPHTRIATLAVDDPGAVGIGSILSKRFDEPQTVRDIELTVDEAGIRVTAWCGGSEREHGRLAGLLRSLAQRATDAPLYGKYRYRVVSMAVDGRVELQAVSKASGVPDLRPISVWPGVAGAHAQLAPGAVVLVEFIEGARSMPIVTHFAGKDGPGFVPVSLTLGGATGAPAARQGDAVEVLLPPAVFSGTIGGTPATGMLTFTLTKTEGAITAGSGKVKVAT